MRKKLLLWVLLMTLFTGNLFGVVYTGTCGRVQAYFKVDSANLLWYLDTETRVLTITGSGPMRDYDNDWRAPWYQYRADFDRIWVSDSATSIGQMAFNDLWADSIHIGNSVEEVRDNSMSNSSFQSLVFPFATKTIGSSACQSNSHLKRAIFQDGVERIESYAFAWNDSLQIVDFGSSRVFIGWQAFSDCRQNHTVHGSKIVSIEGYAFSYNSSLADLVVGDTLQYIGYHAFRSCTSLSIFILPASTNQIDSPNPFDHCSGLDSLSVEQGNMTFDSRNGCNAIMRTANNSLVSGCVNTVIPDDCVEISDFAFGGCNRMIQISIPNSVITINQSAFEECSGLRNVYLPNSVTNVGCNAFYRCDSLQSPVYNNKLFARLPHKFNGIYTMPQGIEEITCGAMYDCDSLTSVIMPQSLRRIGDNAFIDCQLLDTLSIPKKVNRLGTQSFSWCGNLRNINLPDSITNIPWYIFNGCVKLQSIVIPDAVSVIESDAFRGCISLKHVTIPANLIDIGRPFEGCDSLNSVVWNAKDCHLDIWAFYYPTIQEAKNNVSSAPFYAVRHSIKSFVFGDSVRVIPRFLCYEMDSITSINIPANVDSIERCAFDYCNSVTSISWNSRHCNSQISYVYSPFYTIRSGVNTFTFGDSVRTIPAYLCHGMSSITQLHIPSLVSYIGPYAFRYLNQLDTIWVNSDNAYYDCRNRCNALLETATDSLIIGCWKTNIPQNTKAIGPYAFRNVRRLTKAIVPEGVTYIGEEAFNGCKELDSVILPTKLKAILDYTFQDCDSLRYLRMPDSLRTVGLRAFSNCYKLPTLTLAETLTWMDDYSFSNCSGLLDIYCNAYNPPTITANTFSGSSCPIYVPCAQVNTYRNAPNWYNFRSRINGQYYITFDARANDYSFGDVTILQQPNCEHSAKVEARPVKGYDFLGWVTLTGDTVSKDSIYEFVPVEDITLIGVFQKHIDPEYGITLIVRPDDITHGSAIVVIAPNFNQNAEIEARASAGYQFVAWIKDDGDTVSKQKIYNFDPETVYNDGRDTVVLIAVFEVRQGVENTDENLSLDVWTEHEIINVLIPEDGVYYLYDISGMLVESVTAVAGEIVQFRTEKPGVYILKSTRYSTKVVTL